MGTPRDKNSCLYPFGNNYLTLFALMVLDDEDRRRMEGNSEEQAQEENELDLEDDVYNDFDEEEDDSLID
jgi:hypothetical protein